MHMNIVWQIGYPVQRTVNIRNTCELPLKLFCPAEADGSFHYYIPGEQASPASYQALTASSSSAAIDHRGRLLPGQEATLHISYQPLSYSMAAAAAEAAAEVAAAAVVDASLSSSSSLTTSNDDASSSSGMVPTASSSNISNIPRSRTPVSGERSSLQASPSTRSRALAKLTAMASAASSPNLPLSPQRNDTLRSFKRTVANETKEQIRHDHLVLRFYHEGWDMMLGSLTLLGSKGDLDLQWSRYEMNLGNMPKDTSRVALFVVRNRGEVPVRLGLSATNTSRAARSANIAGVGLLTLHAASPLTIGIGETANIQASFEVQQTGQFAVPIRVNLLGCMVPKFWTLTLSGSLLSLTYLSSVTN
jgi:hypothetical protein